jgi:hypothetical protein
MQEVMNETMGLIEFVNFADIVALFNLYLDLSTYD